MKTKSIVLGVLFTFLFSCTPSNILTQTELQDPTPSFTFAINPTSTQTPTTTPTQIPTCNDQELPDLNDPGIPTSTNRTDGPGGGFLEYNEDRFYVYKKEMHNRVVTVAIQKEFGDVNEEDRVNFSEYIFTTWAVIWKEFGGFPFKSYTIILGENLPYDAEATSSGEFGMGFESSKPPEQMEYWSHGIFHAWIGNGFRQHNDARWLMEGFTEYYGIRQSGDGKYYSNMSNAYSLYKEVREAGRDIPLYSINGLSGALNPNLDNLHYWKGAMVAYLLDLEMKKTGHHLGEVARDLYQKDGIYSQGAPTDEEILNTINQITGADFSDFFDKYIFGTEPLPVDPTKFVWVCHDSNILIIPTPEPTPTSSISLFIDGSKSDWRELTFSYDPNGDSISGDTDIIGYSYAQDGNFVDIILETYAPIKGDNSTLDITLLLRDTSGNIKDYELNVNSDGAVWGGNYPQEWYGLPGVLVAWKDVVEIQIPKQVFNNFEFVKVKYISLFTDVSGTWTWVDMIE